MVNLFNKENHITQIQVWLPVSLRSALQIGAVSPASRSGGTKGELKRCLWGWREPTPVCWCRGPDLGPWQPAVAYPTRPALSFFLSFCSVETQLNEFDGVTPERAVERALPFPTLNLPLITSDLRSCHFVCSPRCVCSSNCRVIMKKQWNKFSKSIVNAHVGM